ncbi:MAG: GntR family transcriptional regulator [Frankiales bacterium]|nr:GntR family transcriptional regulator [Frankiales bacterium]
MSEAATRASSLGAREPLPLRLAENLRQRLAAGEWASGEQMPTEAELVATYGVSRATVRQALKNLEGKGLIVTRQGRGSFVSDQSMIRAGMQELQSITTTIAEMGHTPAMHYHHKTLRRAKPAELVMFELEDGAEVLDIQRRILADGITVAYSYDVLPRWVFPANFKARDLTGSVFGFLRDNNGPKPVRALAKVHAVDDPAVAWDGDFEPHQLFVLLDQLHYDENIHPFMHTRSFFIEGRFNFTVVREAR